MTRDRPRGSTRSGAARLVRRMGAAILTAGSIIVVWHVAAEIMDSPILPGPTAVAIRLADLMPTLVTVHALASLTRVAVALAAAVVTAVPIGILMGRVGAIRRLADPAVYLLYPIPKIALLPVVFLLVGIGEGARILILWLVLFFQVVVAVRDAAATIPRAYSVSLRVLGASPADHLLHVIVPAILPALLTALRIGSATALAVLFFAETFFTDRGLGFFIVDAWMKASYEAMLAGIVVIALVGVALFAILDAAQRVACRWQRST